MKRISIAILLCVGGALVSGLLLLQHHGEEGAVAAVNEVCGDGTTSGCETVARSPYSAVGGIPLAAMGLAFSLCLALGLSLATMAPAEVRDPVAAAVLAALALALGLDVLLLAVQAFFVKAFCLLCLVTYLLNGGAFVALWPVRRSRAWRAALARSEGRLALAGWALGSLGLVSAVSAADLTLSCRAAGRQQRLLGAPAPGPVLNTAGPAGPSEPASEEVKRLQEQVRKLQETLDDPQKLDQYFAEKAARDYERAPVQSFDLKNVPFRGPQAAPVQVVEYSDFLCPFCRSLAGALSQFLPQSGNRVVIYYKNYPLDRACNPSLKASTHPGACWLAFGGLCAQYEGRFGAYADKVFSTDLRNPQPADVVRLAAQAGLNAAAFEACIADPRTRSDLEAQIAEAQRLGVQATPTLFVNGKKLPRINDFLQVVDKEAQRKGFPPMGQPSPR
jgi:protein-disulfide isomerase/uncharacterized membrane protein